METTTETQPVEQTQPPTEPVATEPVAPAAPEPPTDPTVAAIEGLGSKIDGLLAARSEPAPDPVDLLDALEEEPTAAQQVQPQYEQQQPQVDPETQAQIEDLTRLIDSRAEEMIAPVLQEQREAQVRALEQKYPEMQTPEIRGPLIQKMREIRSRSGNDAVLSDPVMIEMALLAVKAESAGSPAVPAEPAVEGGASLETNAGQSQAGNPSDARQNYIDEVFKGITL